MRNSYPAKLRFDQLFSVVESHAQLDKLGKASRPIPFGGRSAPRLECNVQVSQQVRDIFDRLPPMVEPLSLDEAFLDVAGREAPFGSSTEIGRQIKPEIAN